MTMAMITDDENHDVNHPHDAYKIGEHHIRLDFSYAEDVDPPNVPSALLEIFRLRRQLLDANMQFIYHAGEAIDLDNWPTRSTFQDRFSIQIIERRKYHIMAGLVI
jgi:hypothetical protein